MLLRTLSESRGVLLLSFDDGTTLRVRKKHFAAHPLMEGDEIDLDAYQGRLAQAQWDDCMEAALRALDASAQTARKLKEKLVRQGYVPPVAQAVIERLQELRMIDDQAMAQRIAQNKTRSTDGIYAVKRKLVAKGIDRDTAEAAAEQYLTDEQQREAARAFAQKRLSKLEDLPPRAIRAKLSQALARRGFSWEIIEEVVDPLIDQQD